MRRQSPVPRHARMSIVEPGSSRMTAVERSLTAALRREADVGIAWESQAAITMTVEITVLVTNLTSDARVKRRAVALSGQGAGRPGAEHGCQRSGQYPVMRRQSAQFQRRPRRAGTSIVAGTESAQSAAALANGALPQRLLEPPGPEGPHPEQPLARPWCRDRRLPSRWI